MSKPQTNRKLFVLLLVICIGLLLALAIILTNVYPLKKNESASKDANKTEFSKVIKKEKKTDDLYYTAEEALHGYYSGLISGSERDAMNAIAPDELWVYLSKVYSITEENAFEKVYFDWDCTWDEWTEEMAECIDKNERYSIDAFMNTKIISTEEATEDEKKIITTLFGLADIDSQIQILNFTDNDFWDTDFNEGYSYCINGRWYYLPRNVIFGLWEVYEEITGDDSIQKL